MSKASAARACPVQLTMLEAFLAIQTGVVREIESRQKRRQNKHGLEESKWDFHIEGAGGEMAVTKLLGSHFEGRVNSFKAPDVGKLQVRTRSKDHWDLIIRKDDADDEVFVLVTGQMASYAVVGWIVAKDGKRPEWWANHGDREPAWFVPQAALHSMGTLELE